MQISQPAINYWVVYSEICFGVNVDFGEPA